jgi:hypothetical protein
MARWRLKPRGDGSFNITLEERYLRNRPRLVELLPVFGEDGLTGAGWEFIPSIAAHEAVLEHVRDRLEQELQRHFDAEHPAATWTAWKLLVATQRDDALRANLPVFHEDLRGQDPRASLWLVKVDHTVMARLSVVRGLFAAAHAPELMSRTSQDFEGFLSARGLSDNAGTGVDALIDTFCAWLAPWVLGIASIRQPSSLVTLFGDPVLGIDVPSPRDMLQLFRSNLLVEVKREGPTERPHLADGQAVSALSWWVERCNELVFELLDPAYFRTGADEYDPAAHLAMLLSFDRLIGSTLSILANDPRGKFVRRLLLFDVLEILEGLGLGGYDQLCSYEKQQREIERLRTILPSTVADLLLPRCERAVAALERVGRGFLQERQTNGGVRVAKKTGGSEELTTSGAVAAYLRGVRNATHSFRKAASDPRTLSLLAGHDGQLPDAVSDLSALHLLRVLVDPARVLPHQRGPRI